MVLELGEYINMSCLDDFIEHMWVGILVDLMVFLKGIGVQITDNWKNITQKSLNYLKERHSGG